jgi:hypothetical protein
MWNKRTDFCLFILLLLATACASIDCPIQTAVYTVYSVKDGNEHADTLKDTILVWTTRLDRKDTLLLYNRGVNLTTFNLPISYDAPEDTLYFYLWKEDYDNLDTVWIAKTNTPHFESVDCKASFFHDITSVRSTHHGIDTIIINNPSVNYDPSTEHFHIHFKAHD